ncbi:MAG: hypothetical protein GMKNLPBB_02336 [Myxococcota bacterium]|nr:hypothetical protein [Myxococcota bacterium]
MAGESGIRGWAWGMVFVLFTGCQRGNPDLPEPVADVDFGEAASSVLLKHKFAKSEKTTERGDKLAETIAGDPWFASVIYTFDDSRSLTKLVLLLRKDASPEKFVEMARAKWGEGERAVEKKEYGTIETWRWKRPRAVMEFRTKPALGGEGMESDLTITRPL